MDIPISSVLVDFIRRECGALAIPKEITADTGIQRDLGVYGDDATEFLLAYAKTFRVDVTQLMAADYFDGESPDVLGFILRLFVLAKQNRKELTVGHLQKGIDAKRLDEQVIQER